MISNFVASSKKCTRASFQLLQNNYKCFASQPSKPISYYYKVLNISPGCTNEELKSAFLEMVKKYHPDLNKDPKAQQKFLQIQKAYDYIQDALTNKKTQSKPSKQQQNWSTNANKQEKQDYDYTFDKQQAEQFKNKYKEYSRKSRVDESMQFSYNLYKKHHDEMQAKKREYYKVPGQNREEWVHKSEKDGDYWYSVGVGAMMIGIISGAIYIVNMK